MNHSTALGRRIWGQQGGRMQRPAAGFVEKVQAGNGTDWSLVVLQSMSISRTRLKETILHQGGQSKRRRH
eukprot:CAMPEP_0206539122 /NCGR_PEP_ID=MMETSP0325_2-20121206/8262_1 /ASSEMBLY_ACC=CAM_ASM_000347 /TAXON_ID=2866 /ORGANISM="Crypthecodinium cohnii, Strain Seligo" /LENGTH=69 /DNA_ID=CAMNT_0054036675 /DNA_START=208 /DNA_END=414 /DNA_ORIENTATION=-